MTSSSNQPNTTLYLNNLNDKVNKDELRSQLFALFTTYGKIIDIVALKSKKMRGQAFLVFTDLAGATSAMRACEGMVFYDKPLVRTRLTRYRGKHWTIIQHIDYARTKSWATLRKEDPTFIPPTSANASQLATRNGEKRQRDEDMSDGEPQAKREKADDDEEEMEIDDEEEQASANSKPGLSYHLALMRHLPYNKSPGSLYSSACTTSNAKITVHKFTARSDRRCALSPLLPVRNLFLLLTNFMYESAI